MRKEYELRFYNRTRPFWSIIVELLEEHGYEWNVNMRGYRDQTGDYLVFYHVYPYELALNALKEIAKANGIEPL